MTAAENDISIPPKHLIVDYIEIVLLFVIFILGLILNIWSLLAIVYKKRVRRSNNTNLRNRNNTNSLRRRRTGRHFQLTLSLNLCNILTLLTYVLGRLVWLITYQWYGGDILCKFYHFCSLFALQQTSFVMVVIAMYTVWSYDLMPNDYILKRKVNSRILWWLICSPMLSLALSINQWFIFTTYIPYKNFVQCVTIWEIRLHLLNLTRGDKDIENNGNSFGVDTAENLYNFVHLIFVFWLPFIIIVYCYSYVLLHVFKNQLTVQASDRSPEHSAMLRRRTMFRNRLVRRFGRIVLFYLFCWLPYNTLHLITIVTGERYDIIDDHLYLLYSLIGVNCAGNPFLYGFRIQRKMMIRIRKAVENFRALFVHSIQ